MSSIFIRGEPVTISSVVTDPTNSGLVPSSVSLNLRYKGLDGKLKLTTLSMTLGSGKWSVTWDSSVASPGDVHYFLSSTGPVVAVDDGMFELVANPANVQTA